MSPKDKLLETVRQFDRSIENMKRSVEFLRRMRNEVVKTYHKKYGKLPKE